MTTLKNRVNVLYSFIDIVNPQVYKGAIKYKKYIPVVIGNKITFSTSTEIVSNNTLKEKNLSHAFDIDAMVLKQKKIIAERIRVNKLLSKINNNYRYPLISFFISSIFYIAFGGMVLNLILL